MLRSLILTVAAVICKAHVSPTQVPLDRHAPELVWPQVLAIPEIITWALNPTGDAAVYRTCRSDNPLHRTCDLNLLAINAQYPIPPVRSGEASSSASYVFLTDSEVLSIESFDDNAWLDVHVLNYTVGPNAEPPFISRSDHVGRIATRISHCRMTWAPGSGVLAIEPGGDQDPLTFLKLSKHDGQWTMSEQNVQDHPIYAKFVVSNGTDFAFALTGQTHAGLFPTSNVYTLNPDLGVLVAVSDHHSGKVRSLSWSEAGDIAWLHEDKRTLVNQGWVSFANRRFPVGLRVPGDINPDRIIFSRDGHSLFLLAGYREGKSLWHLPVKDIRQPQPTMPVRIPNNGTVIDAVHVGITPLHHSHFIGIVSSALAPPQFWVISHSPGSIPSDNYEQIQLTSIGSDVDPGTYDVHTERSTVQNKLGDQVHIFAFLPRSDKPIATLILVTGTGWQDAWARSWNPLVFAAQGVAIIAVSPTGSVGYGTSFAQARRGQWGNQTIHDILIATEQGLRLYSLDPSQVSLLGLGAFGGFAAHWFQGMKQHPYQSFITQNGIVSPRWWLYETETTERVLADFGFFSLESSSPFYLWDPEQRVAEWKTPELIISHSCDDDTYAPSSHGRAASQILHSRDVRSVLLETDDVGEWYEAALKLILPSEYASKDGT